MANKIGEVDVVVGADATGFEKDLDSKVKKAVDGAAKGAASAGKQFDSVGKTFVEKVSAPFKNLSAKVAPAFDKIKSVAGTAFNGVRDVAGKALSGVGDFLTNLPGPAGAAFTKIGEVSSAAWEHVKSGASTVGDHISSAFHTVTGVVSTVAGGVGKAFSPAWNAIKSGASTVGGHISSAFSGISSVASSVTGALSDKFGGMFSTLLEKGKGFASTLGSIMQGMATTVAGAITTATGYALSKGLGRLVQMDEAQAKMRGLGYTAKDIDSIMQSVTESMEGTAFTYGAAATAAAQYGAAGIKTGDEMTEMLETTANLAAASNSELDQIGNIMAKAATGTAVYTGSIQELSTRGLPIWNELSDVLGVSVDEVQKLASTGKISFEDFAQAAKQSAGTVAEEMGNTASKSFENMFNALGGMGEKFLDAGFQQMAPLFQAITAALYALTPGIENLGNALGDKLQKPIEWLTDKLNAFAERADSTSGSVSKMSAAVGPAIAAFAALGAQGFAPLLTKLPMIGPMFAKVGTKMGALGGPAGIAIAALSGLIATNEPLREAFGNIITKVFETLGNVMEALQPAITTLGDAFGVIADAVGGALAMALEALMPLIEVLLEVMGDSLIAVVEALVPLIVLLAEAFAGLVNFLAPIISAILGALVPAFEKVAEVVSAVFETVVSVVGGAIDAVVGFFTGGESGISSVMDTIKEVVGNVFGWVKDTAAPWIEAAWQVIQDAAQAVGDWYNSELAPLIQAAWDSIKEAAQAVADWWETYLVPVFESIGDVFTWIGENVGTIWENFLNTLQAAWDVIGQPLIDGIKLAWSVLTEWFTLVWENVKVVFTLVWEQMKLVVQTIIGIISGIIQTVMAVITGNWSGAWEAIKGIAQTVWNYIKGSITNIINAIKGVITNVLNAIKSVWSSVWNAIKGVASTVWGGIKSVVSGGINAVKSTVSNVMAGIKSVFTNVWNSIKSFLTSVWSSITGAWSAGVGKVRSIFTKMGNAIKAPFETAFNAIKNLWNNTVGKLSFTVPSWVPKIGGKGWSAPRLAKGGVVNSATMTMIGEGAQPEVVQPLSELKALLRETQRQTARTVMGIVQRGAGTLTVPQPETITDPTKVASQGTVFNAPLLVVQNMTVDSQTRVENLSKELWNRAHQTDRAQGKVNLGGVVK